MQYESEYVHCRIRNKFCNEKKNKLLITTLLMKVVASTARLFTARAHVRPCPVSKQADGHVGA